MITKQIEVSTDSKLYDSGKLHVVSPIQSIQFLNERLMNYEKYKHCKFIDTILIDTKRSEYVGMSNVKSINRGLHFSNAMYEFVGNAVFSQLFSYHGSSVALFHPIKIDNEQNG